MRGDKVAFALPHGAIRAIDTKDLLIIRRDPGAADRCREGRFIGLTRSMGYRTPVRWRKAASLPTLLSYSSVPYPHLYSLRSLRCRSRMRRSHI
jgi:hypothetical protein